MIIEARDDTITLRGTIKADIWPAIQAAAALLLENHPTGIIIDCSALANITAKGAETFADAFKYIQSQNARIVVAGLSPELVEVGKAVPGVRSQLPLAATVEEARASLKLEELTPQRGKAREAAVVPILGNWRRAVYFADKLAVGESCEVHLVDLIKVPRTLPIGTPLPERETEGQERLESAKEEVKEMKLKSFSHVEHVRSNSAGLIDFVKQLNADFTIISIDHGAGSIPHMEEPEAMSLIESAEFEVSLIRGMPDDPMAPVKNAVIPAVGAWEHALEYACKLVHGQNALITVTYIIQVPRSEPIDASKPDAEAAASDCAKEAARIGKRYGVKVNPTVERVRDSIIGFQKLVEANKYDLVIVGVKRETSGDYHIAHSIADSLLHELPCEVIFLRAGDVEHIS